MLGILVLRAQTVTVSVIFPILAWGGVGGGACQCPKHRMPSLVQRDHRARCDTGRREQLLEPSSEGASRLGGSAQSGCEVWVRLAWCSHLQLLGLGREKTGGEEPDGRRPRLLG